jgi:ATP-dependent Clp protease adaptor protein ClpS
MENVKTHKLTVYNDDVNSYEYIIACLIRFCKHDPIQAEQCAVIAHNKGKCAVKIGDFNDIYEMHADLKEMSIKTEIEVYESSMS